MVKDEDVNDVAEEVMAFILNRLQKEESSYSLTEITLSDIRRAKSIASVASSEAGDLSTFSEDDSDLDFVASGDDSDAEFEQYLTKTLTRRHKNFMKEHCWQFQPKKCRLGPEKQQVIDEYENWPDFEKLTISCEKTKNLRALGLIESIVGCVALVKPLDGISTILDLETVIFGKDGDVFGTICDIVGTVKSPIYCIKLKSTVPKDFIANKDQVFFAPTVKEYTKKLLETKLDDAWENEVESDDEDVMFSDDEKEKQYRSIKNAKKAASLGRQQPGQRKRTHNKVHFQELPQQSVAANDSCQRGRGGQAGQWHGRGNNQTRVNTNQRNRQFIQKPPSLPNSEETTPPPRKEPIATSDNPYAEFGCYDTFTGVDVSKSVYRRL